MNWKTLSNLYDNTSLVVMKYFLINHVWSYDIVKLLFQLPFALYFLSSNIYYCHFMSYFKFYKFHSSSYYFIYSFLLPFLFIIAILVLFVIYMFTLINQLPWTLVLKGFLYLEPALKIFEEHYLVERCVEITKAKMYSW